MGLEQGLGAKVAGHALGLSFPHCVNGNNNDFTTQACTLHEL